MQPFLPFFIFLLYGLNVFVYLLNTTYIKLICVSFNVDKSVYLFIVNHCIKVKSTLKYNACLNDVIFHKSFLSFPHPTNIPPLFFLNSSLLFSNVNEYSIIGSQLSYWSSYVKSIKHQAFCHCIRQFSLYILFISIPLFSNSFVLFSNFSSINRAWHR